MKRNRSRSIYRICRVISKYDFKIHLPLNQIWGNFFITSKVPWHTIINQPTITRICSRGSRKNINKKILLLCLNFIIIIAWVPWSLGIMVDLFMNSKSFSSSSIIRSIVVTTIVKFGSCWSFVFRIVMDIVAMLMVVVALKFL